MQPQACCSPQSQNDTNIRVSRGVTNSKSTVLKELFYNGVVPELDKLIDQYGGYFEF